jgi:hypothetical protein
VQTIAYLEGEGELPIEPNLTCKFFQFKEDKKNRPKAYFRVMNSRFNGQFRLKTAAHSSTIRRTLLIAGILLTVATGARGNGFGDLSPYFSFIYGDGDMPGGVPNSAGQTTSPGGESVDLYGQAGPITGADFGFGFVLYWNGGFDGPIGPGDNFSAALDFDVAATGGTVSWDFFADIFSGAGDEDARIQTGSTPVPASGQVDGVLLESTPFTQQGTTGYFEGYLHLDWSGYSPDDTLTVTIPQGSSIDLTYNAVPDRGAWWMDAGVLTLTALAGLRQRQVRV